MLKILSAGYFDPLTGSHISHLKGARALGGPFDELWVITHPDEVVVRKKGFFLLPVEHRVMCLQEYPFVNKVAVDTLDTDGTVAKAILTLEPDIFAKGKDRNPSNMPKNELEACEKVGCKIVYGIGDELGHSTQFFLNAVEMYLAHRGAK